MAENDDKKIQLADKMHALEVKGGEFRTLQSAAQLSDSVKAVAAKQKEIIDLQKEIKDLKTEIYGA